MIEPIGREQIDLIRSCAPLRTYKRARLPGQLDAITTPASLRVPERARPSMPLVQQHPQR